MPGYFRENRLIKTALSTPQLQVGLAVDGTHGGGEFVQRRGVDEVDRERQRHAQHHRYHRSRVAPRVVAKLLPGEGFEEGEHGAGRVQVQPVGLGKPAILQACLAGP